MAARLVGWAAIAFAERQDCTLSAHADGAEPARDGVSVAEARRIAATQPDRIYVDFDEPDGDLRLA